MDAMSSLIIGVIAGILTSALLFILVQLFNKVVLPWYRDIVYKGINIEGMWQEVINFEGGVIQTYNVVLEQKADKIKGKIVQVKSKEGQVLSSENMIIDGRLKDRFLCAKIEFVNKARLGIASILLEVVGDGSSMKGSRAWYDIGLKEISSLSTTWSKDKI